MCAPGATWCWTGSRPRPSGAPTGRSPGWTPGSATRPPALRSTCRWSRHLRELATRAAGADAIALPTLGGSVPLHHFGEALGAPTVILPIANPDNNQHAANENLRLGNLWYGVDLFALLLTTPWRP